MLICMFKAKIKCSWYVSFLWLSAVAGFLGQADTHYWSWSERVSSTYDPETFLLNPDLKAGHCGSEEGRPQWGELERGRYRWTWVICGFPGGTTSLPVRPAPIPSSMRKPTVACLWRPRYPACSFWSSSTLQGVGWVENIDDCNKRWS